MKVVRSKTMCMQNSDIIHTPVPSSEIKMSTTCIDILTLTHIRLVSYLCDTDEAQSQQNAASDQCFALFA